MIYVFEDLKTKEIVEIHFRIAEAPPIGAEILYEGKMYRRLPNYDQIHIDTAGIARKTHKYPYVSHQMPRNMPGAKHDKKGKPIIRSRLHENEIMAQHGYERD